MSRINGDRNARLFGRTSALALAVLVACTHASAARSAQTVEPDYTKGEKLEGKFNYWNMGSIGIIGNLWATRSAGTGEQTKDTRMIQIKSVIEGTPADGVLKEGDVILGVGNGRFTTDARKTLSAAITEAEEEKNGGKLVLTIWRAGDTRAVTIILPVLGSFSDVSPWACEKTDAIVEAACENILDRGLFAERRGKRSIKGGIPTRLEVLGLLATGDEKYLPIIKDYVRELADSLKEADGDFHSWNISYETLLLTEYCLATGDEYVLPAIEKVAVRIARGASDVGTFSHGSAYSFMAHGKSWKYPSAYGAMNQCSITCALALVLARKCGVKNDEVNRVIRRAAYFYRWYVDKGTIPYVAQAAQRHRRHALLRRRHGALHRLSSGRQRHRETGSRAIHSRGQIPADQSEWRRTLHRQRGLSPPDGGGSGATLGRHLLCHQVPGAQRQHVRRRRAGQWAGIDGE